MFKSKGFLFFLFFSIFLLLFGRVRIAPPDLAFYYSFAHSLVYDLDFCFANQYEHFPFAYHELYLSSEGYPANDWPMGTGICWTPFLLLNRFLSFPVSFLGLNMSGSGYDWFAMWLVSLGATMLYGGGTVYLSYRLCRLEGFGKSSSLWATALIAIGSSFTYHLYVNSADSHPPSAFFSVLFLLSLRHYQQTPDEKKAMLIGAVTGMAALVRPHNILLLIIPAVELFFSGNRARNYTKQIIGLSLMICTSAFVFFPQLLVWKELYGNWLAIPRANEVLWTQPELYKMLFSDFHGMISWSPLFGLGILGLFTKKRFIPFTIPVLLQIYIYSCNLAWWAGGSFGNRRMLGCVPFFLLGLAALFDTVPKLWLKCLSCLAALWTLLLLFAEVSGEIQLNHYQPWPEIISAVTNGFVPGIIAHFTAPEWGEYSMERLMGFGILLILLPLTWQGIYLLKRKTFTYLTTGILILATFINLVCLSAAIKSPKALAESDTSDYFPYDRFTWVVYYEHGFYLMKTDQNSRSLEKYLAACIIEPRHPEPWMYASYLMEQFEWYEAGYYYAYEGMVRGQRSGQFFDLFERLLDHMIQTQSERLHLYYNQRGVIHALRRDYVSAEYDFRMALQTKSDYDLAQKNIEIMKGIQLGKREPFQWQ